MKRVLILITIAAVLFVGLGNLVIAGDGPHGPNDPASAEATGPAPNSGDHLSDGSGLDKGADRDDKGAPNSGDGVPDGSGK